MAYVRALQQQLPSLSEKLSGLKLEPDGTLSVDREEP